MTAAMLAVLLAAGPADAPAARTVFVQLVDDAGLPVAGALAEPFGAETADRRWWGGVDEVKPATSGADGRAVLILPDGYRGVDVRITARGYAGTSETLLKPGPEEHRIVVPAGTRVTGRLVHDGRPVAGLRVALVQMERSAGHHFVEPAGTTSDAAGRFEFDHLPANQDYCLFTLVGDGSQKLALPTKRFLAHADRQTRDLKDLAVVPALRLAGRLDLPAGQALPKDARLALHRQPAWESVAAPVAADGTFSIDGLPPESYEIEVPSKSLAIDAARTSYQLTQANAIGLRLRETTTDLVLPVMRVQTPASRR
jgi:hypothetical protein